MKVFPLINEANLIYAIKMSDQDFKSRNTDKQN